ncbi:membrane protein [Vibrio sp. VPAP30]|nr:membrane protein [Vibrio sp. VPAP30]
MLHNKEVSMEHNLKYALVITAVVFAVLLGFGITAITTA